MSTVTLVGIYKQLAAKPRVERHRDYVMQRIEKELEKRANEAQKGTN